MVVRVEAGPLPNICCRAMDEAVSIHPCQEKAKAADIRRFQELLSNGARFRARLLQPTLMDRRNSMLLPVFLSLFKTNSMASTGGTPVKARRKMTTLLYSSGW